MNKLTPLDALAISEEHLKEVDRFIQHMYAMTTRQLITLRAEAWDRDADWLANEITKIISSKTARRRPTRETH